jgi:hypothetical protein
MDVKAGLLLVAWPAIVMLTVIVLFREPWRPPTPTLTETDPTMIALLTETTRHLQDITSQLTSIKLELMTIRLHQSMPPPPKPVSIPVYPPLEYPLEKESSR